MILCLPSPWSSCGGLPAGEIIQPASRCCVKYARRGRGSQHGKTSPVVTAQEQQAIAPANNDRPLALPIHLITGSRAVWKRCCRSFDELEAAVEDDEGQILKARESKRRGRRPQRTSNPHTTRQINPSTANATAAGCNWAAQRARSAGRLPGLRCWHPCRRRYLLRRLFLNRRRRHGQSWQGSRRGGL